jgi:transformation/transcription domain-associated protein
MFIPPMLTHAFQHNHNWDVMDTIIIKTIVDKLLDLLKEVNVDYDEPLWIELL